MTSIETRSFCDYLQFHILIDSLPYLISSMRFEGTCQTGFNLLMAELSSNYGRCKTISGEFHNSQSYFHNQEICKTLLGPYLKFVRIYFDATRNMQHLTKSPMTEQSHGSSNSCRNIVSYWRNHWTPHCIRHHQRSGDCILLSQDNSQFYKETR